jgi:hypothetical protein
MVLAARLLEKSHSDIGAAVYSVIPVIDQKPAHFHRVYGHILENQPDFLDATLELFKRPELAKRDFKTLNRFISSRVSQLRKEYAAVSADSYAQGTALEKKIYALERLGEEMPEFLKLLGEARDVVGDERVTEISTDERSAAVSLLSHTFFDTFNNPVQIFLPGCSYCSAQWDFWSRIDYMKFRGEFYKPENIIPFRAEIAASDVWDVDLRPEALIEAMIIRVGELGQPAISRETIDLGVRDFLGYLGVNGSRGAERELAFLRNVEREITEVVCKKFPRNDRAG